jgi:predicted transcriptional regulator YdeE
LAFIAAPSIVLADDEVYSGPFYMCPDAHGADQKALFRIIDMTRMPMRIEGRGPQRIDGYAASLAASRTLEMINKKNPIAEAFERLAGTTTTMSADKRRLGAVCFATTPAPKEDVDGPFVFMPGYLIESSADVLQPLDTITVPAQTYLVVTYKGADVGDRRHAVCDDRGVLAEGGAIPRTPTRRRTELDDLGARLERQRGSNVAGILDANRALFHFAATIASKATGKEWVQQYHETGSAVSVAGTTSTLPRQPSVICTGL